MKERLTILISSEHKKFIKRQARRQNKNISKFIDDLLSKVMRVSAEKNDRDEWIDKTARAYTSGKKDILSDLFKGISK